MNSRWVRSLPLLLSAAVLFIAGALMFYKSGDTTASISSMTAGVLAFGAWVVTAVIDWHEGKPQQVVQSEEGNDDSAIG